MLFLLSDAHGGIAHQLIQSLAIHTCPAIAFVSEYENVVALCEEFPSVTWIVLDVTKSVDFLQKIFRFLPLPNYVVNFSGPGFKDVTLDALQQACGQRFKERERGYSELTFDGITEDDDEIECKIFVNVVEKRSGLKKKSKTITKAVGRFVVGARERFSNILNDDEDTEENEPLINRSNEEQQSPPSFLRSLFIACCPCFGGGPPEPDYIFLNPQDLRLQMKSEQLTEIHELFRRLLKNSRLKWERTLEDLRRKESAKIEELVSKIHDMREQEEQELTSMKEGQNRNTRQNLSSVLSADVIKKIEESRSRQTKGKVEYDTDRAYREGEAMIIKQTALDKAQLHERHYIDLVKEELDKLRHINSKYQNKTRTLQARYFGNNF